MFPPGRYQTGTLGYPSGTRHVGYESSNPEAGRLQCG